MGMVMAARPPASEHAHGVRGVSVRGSGVGVVARGRVGGGADAGKVLVFTGTAGTAERRHRDRGQRAAGAGTAGGYTVDVTSDAAADQRREPRAATARWCSSTPPATCSTPRRRAALQDYVKGGGGFVGIGETAKLEEGATRSSTR